MSGQNSASCRWLRILRGLFSQWLNGKESAFNAGGTRDMGLIPGSGRSPGEGNGNPLQYSCLENSMDRGVWGAYSPWSCKESDTTWACSHMCIYGVAKSRTQLSDFPFTFHFPALEKETATHSSVLAWRIPGTGCRVGCRLWGRTELDTTEVTRQQQCIHI